MPLLRRPALERFLSTFLTLEDAQQLLLGCQNLENDTFKFICHSYRHGGSRSCSKGSVGHRFKTRLEARSASSAQAQAAEVGGVKLA